MKKEHTEPDPSVHSIENETYDRKIVPAETAARMEREGENYKHLPQPEEQDFDTTGGYSLDGEGLLNNYAVEPEMYYETPGDAKAQAQQEEALRAQERAEANDTDEQGKLTLEDDKRGKGVGLI